MTTDQIVGIALILAIIALVIAIRTSLNIGRYKNNGTMNKPNKTNHFDPDEKRFPRNK